MLVRCTRSQVKASNNRSQELVLQRPTASAGATCSIKGVGAAKAAEDEDHTHSITGAGAAQVSASDEAVYSFTGVGAV